MIVFTLLYSGWFTDGLPEIDRQLHWRIWWILPIHLAVQSCYTVALHVRHLIPFVRRITPLRFGVFFVLFLLAVTLGNAGNLGFRYANQSLGEITYRCFMSFYGLVFPAYVLLNFCAGKPQWAGFGPPSSWQPPFYELGFIERKAIWLLPGMAIVLIFWLSKSGKNEIPLATDGAQMHTDTDL